MTQANEILQLGFLAATDASMTRQQLQTGAGIQHVRMPSGIGPIRDAAQKALLPSQRLDLIINEQRGLSSRKNW